MSNAVIRELDHTFMKKDIPQIQVGYTVRVVQKITEGDKTREQAFEGLVIKMNLKQGLSHTITVRKIVDGIGVEKVFPLYAPSITKIEVVKMADVRRAKLYYMRDRAGKSARLVEKMTTKDEREKMIVKGKGEKIVEEIVEEEVVA